MFNRAGLFALSAFFSISAASAAPVDFDRGTGGLKGELSGVQVPAPSPAGEKGLGHWLFGNHSAPQKVSKEWTIMVFINGKNNLEQYALKDMNEMEMVGSTDKLNIVTETGRIDGYDDSDGDWTGTRRYLVQKDTDTEKVSSKVVQDLGKTDMGDYKSLIAFGKWAKAKYPAKKYMLIVWNHGSGWEKSLRFRVNKGISYDDETDNHITTPQLGLALKEMGGVDVYGSDACLMQMPEVDYELKDGAAYIVGSEETEPGDGYTYNTFLGPVAAKPAMTPAELAKVAVDAYSDHYREQRTGSTQSFIKTAALPGLVARVNAWADAVMAAGLNAEVAAARSEALSYSISENKDLYHLVSLVAGKTQDAGVKAKSADLQNYIAKDLVQHNRFNDQPDSGSDNSPDDWDTYRAKLSKWGGKDYSQSHGIAVYLPGSAAAEGYSELAWASASKWDEFIAWDAAK